MLENHLHYDNLVIIGIQPRGIFFSDRIVQQINEQIKPAKITYGKLDNTFYRDDVRQGLHTLNQTDMLFSVENKTVILVDDVLYTGRTIRAALDALFDHGRPKSVQLLVLIDRGHRELPIEARFIGRTIPTSRREIIEVKLNEIDGEEQVILVELTDQA